MNSTQKNRLIAIIFLLITQCVSSKMLKVPRSPGLDRFSAIPGHSAQRLSSSPYLSGDTFRAYCDFVIDKTNNLIDPENIKNGDLIFIAAHKEFLDFFFKEVHPKIKSRYILVTHNSDKSYFEDYLRYLDDSNIIAWFGQNLTLEHKKTFPIPIGLANRYWKHGNTNIIDKVRNNLPENKDILLYMNFAFTNKTERLPVYNIFANKKFCYKSKGKPFGDYINDLARSKFVISPPGNGIDCHRTWEALLLGAIPIVSSTKLDRMYKDLPVIIVDDWNLVTEDFINKKYEEMRKKTYKLEKLFIDYWLKEISKLKESKL